MFRDNQIIRQSDHQINTIKMFKYMIVNSQHIRKASQEGSSERDAAALVKTPPRVYRLHLLSVRTQGNTTVLLSLNSTHHFTQA